jgi:DNA polymerase-3 subunit gamma/tau
LDSDQAWRDIIATLQAEQPALAAVLEHGAPVEVTRDKLVISFPQGSFFGRQAGSTPAKQALLEAAQRVFGQRPRIEIGFGLSSDRPTVAAQEENKRKARRDELEQAARNHPRVKEALDVFPEVEGQFEVKVED